ncbi:MAG: Na/Pi cotransporter family protein [Ruminococcaceae bacterium]|nr:Na/Pi cotransporter family protein [Oscillospiraceae bacterium]
MQGLPGMLISLLGGLGLFLFGMHVMSEGLERAAGQRMSHIIEKMTGNVFKGVLAGALVTALIQSSSATTVMVIGFVNSGIMRLSQTVGVIMGANIGTTITAQLLSLSDIGGGAWYLSLLKPANFAPVLICIGVFMLLFSKRKSLSTVGSILSGFGMIFIGMSMMEGAVSPLRELEEFRRVFETLTNPILGVLAGMAITAIIQSSSASVGILQAATVTGSVTFSSAAPIILGQNIGTCVTAMLSGVGASKNARKAAVIHLAFNVIGTVVFLVALYLLRGFLPFWNEPINKSGIANFHLVFNICNTLLLLPFSGVLVKLADKLVREKEAVKPKTTSLDSRFLETPALAVSQATRETLNMASLALENYNLAKKALLDGDISGKERLYANETRIDELESKITRYLMQIVDEDLSEEDSKITSSLFHVLIDAERVGDRCQNLFKIAERARENGISLSATARHELDTIMRAVGDIYESSIICYEERDQELVRKVQTYENVIDNMRKRLRDSHVDRLAYQDCCFDAAIIFLDVLSHVERIADHSANIANRTEQLIRSRGVFDLHKDAKEFREQNPELYRQYYREFEEKYSLE